MVTGRQRPAVAHRDDLVEDCSDAAPKSRWSSSCWGDDTFDVTYVPGGSFRDVATASFRACGVKDDGGLVCWGSGFQAPDPPGEGTYTAIVAGDSHFCALQDDGGVACWGEDDDQQASPPNLVVARRILYGLRQPVGRC